MSESSSVLQQESKLYTILPQSRITRKGRSIFDYKCNICNKTFHDHTNATRHCKKCLAIQQSGSKQLTIEKSLQIPMNSKKTQVVPETIPDPEQPPPKLPVALSKLVQLFASQNYAYTSINDPSWRGFIEALNPDFAIPSSRDFRNIIIQYSVILTHQGLTDLRDQVCGLAIDGATIRDSHFYAMILVHVSKLRLLAITQVPDQKFSTIAELLADAHKHCDKYNIRISAIVSDSASNLKSLFTGSNRYMFSAMLGYEILRIACAAHTSQLAIVTFKKNDKNFSDFCDELLMMIRFLSERRDDFKQEISEKMPKFIGTRWNSLTGCLEFVIKHQDIINDILPALIHDDKKDYDEAYADALAKGYNPPPLPKYPPARVPPNWINYFNALEVVRTFTDRVEGDLCLLQDVWLSYVEAISQFQALKTVEATQLQAAFTYRFTTTHNIDIARLAYYFTPYGLQELKVELLNKAFNPTYDRIKGLFRSLAIKTYGEEAVVENYIASTFDEYTHTFIFNADENPFRHWAQQYENIIEINGVKKKINLEMFSSIALALISIPATEAMVERCFSGMKRLVTEYNSKMKTDLYLALSQIKIAAKYCNKWVPEEDVTHEC